MSDDEVISTNSSITKVQKTLGLLFTPVGVIALFCNVLGVSGQNTASISLAAVTLTAICLYRRAINTTVPSSLVLALLIALTATFTLNYEHILFKDTGLIRYFHTSNDFLGQASPFLDNAKKEIWFVGVDFHITAGDRKNLILSKLDQGVKVRFLIFDPSSKFLDTMAEDFDQDPKAITSECMDSLQSILSLRNDWKHHDNYSHYSDSLEIRIFEDVPHARFYLIDPDDPKAQSFYIPYMNHENSPGLPGYLMRNIEHGVIQELLPGVRKLWDESVPLDTYINQHTDKL